MGETAIDKSGAVATMNMLSYSPKGGTQLIVMNRYYDAKYQSIYGRSIGEGSSVHNVFRISSSTANKDHPLYFHQWPPTPNR